MNRKLLDPVMFGPNITGNFNPSCEYAIAVTASGAFSSSSVGSQTVTGSYTTKGTPQFSFDASKSN